MRKTIFLYIFAPLFFLAATATAEEFKTIKGNGDIVTKDIPISEYTQLKISDNIEKPVFNYSQKEGQASSVRLTIDSNLLPHLEIKAQKGSLVIHTKNGERLQPTRLIVDAQSARLIKAHIDGAFRFTFRTGLNAKNLKLTAEGMSDVRSNKPIRVGENCKMKASDAGRLKATDLQCSHLNVVITDCGMLDLKGEAQNGKYKVGDAGGLKAYGFVTEELDFRVDGAGKGEVHVTVLEGDVS
ncbi:GIN domain-containing protein [Parabacteroides sp.]